VSFYRWLARGLTIDLPMRNDEKLFYRHRARFNELLRSGGAESREAAGLFYYLNRTGYNGLCRFNKSGEFNVPFGQYAKIPYVRDFAEYAPLLQAWTFSTADVEEVPLEPGDFVYADPPYDVEFTAYAQGGFSWNDQMRVAEYFARHAGPVVLVNQSTKRIEELYRSLGYEIDHLDAPRRISCTGDRRPAREVVAVRNLT
jgi:DNA adenine methylase